MVGFCFGCNQEYQVCACLAAALRRQLDRVEVTFDSEARSDRSESFLPFDMAGNPKSSGRKFDIDISS